MVLFRNAKFSLVSEAIGRVGKALYFRLIVQPYGDFFEDKSAREKKESSKKGVCLSGRHEEQENRFLY